MTILKFARKYHACWGGVWDALKLGHWTMQGIWNDPRFNEADRSWCFVQFLRELDSTTYFALKRVIRVHFQSIDNYLPWTVNDFTSIMYNDCINFENNTEWLINNFTLNWNTNEISWSSAVDKELEKFDEK